MLYRGRKINISKDIFMKYLFHCHAPIEKYFVDCAMHRKYDVDVRDDEDITDFSDYQIEEAVLSCAEEDIKAVGLMRC